MNETTEPNERERILRVYKIRAERDRRHNNFFGYEGIAHFVRIQERHRETLRLLRKTGYHPLADFHILDVGCGDGNTLRQFLQYGAVPEKLAGIELREEPVEKSHYLSPHLDVRCGSATELPWADDSFDLVCQHTVYTSILDAGMKQQGANEMRRVLRDGGAVLWYDFMYNNPRNPDVRGVKRREIQSLFPDYQIHLRKITLAPPIARRLPEPLLPILYPLFASIPFLRTHYIGIFIKQ